MKTAMIAKQELRNEIRIRRAALPPSWVAASSALIEHHVLRLPELNGVSVAAAFLSLPGEPETTGLILRLRRADLRICVPAREDATHAYQLAWLDEDTPLAPDRFRVPQPMDPHWIGDTAPDILFIPGVAFDRRGHRLGHGRGFYDRMLVSVPGVRVGLAFDFQRVGALPVEPHDLSMDVVVTETGSHRP